MKFTNTTPTQTSFLHRRTTRTTSISVCSAADSNKSMGTLWYETEFECLKWIFCLNTCYPLFGALIETFSFGREQVTGRPLQEQREWLRSHYKEDDKWNGDFTSNLPNFRARNCYNQLKYICVNFLGGLQGHSLREHPVFSAQASSFPRREKSTVFLGGWN